MVTAFYIIMTAVFYFGGVHIGSVLFFIGFFLSLLWERAYKIVNEDNCI
jgi:hypothetical protein